MQSIIITTIFLTKTKIKLSNVIGYHQPDLSTNWIVYA